jgi:hypothetical protein
MIDITGVDLAKFAQKAYALSSRQGMGMQANPETTLSDADAQKLVQPTGHIALSMDYVNGRACKLTVFREDGKLSMRDAWYDHTDSQLRELLAEHGISCNCVKCRVKREVSGPAVS